MDRGRGGHGWVVLCYFFLGALFGLVVLTISSTIAVTTLFTGAPGEAVAAALLSAFVGGVVLYLHLTEGLKRSQADSQLEPPAAGETSSVPDTGSPAATATTASAPRWPSAVYYRVGALVGLIAAVSGAVAVCGAIASALFGPDVPTGDFATFVGQSNGKDFAGGLLVTAVGLLVMWWHLNEARKRGE